MAESPWQVYFLWGLCGAITLCGVRLPAAPSGVSATAWGSLAIAAFAVVNLCGVRWGGRTQVLLTVVKVAGLLALGLGVGGLTLLYLVCMTCPLLVR